MSQDDPIIRAERLIRGNMLVRAGLGARYSKLNFSMFSPSEQQKTAFSAAKQFVRKFNSGTTYGEGMIFAGNCGSGKTMLAAAVACEVVAGAELDDTRVYLAAIGCDDSKNTETPVKFVNIVELFDNLRRMFDKSDNENADLLEELKRVPLLILDDLGAEKPTGWTAERLYELINYRYMEELPIIVTTNCKPDDLKLRLGERIFDRLRSTCAYIPMATPESLRSSVKLN